MIRIGIIALLIALTGACTGQRSFSDDWPVIILNDGGGQLISAEADRLKLLNRGVPVEIRGYCASACVVFTTLPNACLGVASRIGFHSSNISVPFLIGDAQMSRYLRGGIKREYDRTWSKSQDLHWISAREYVRLDPAAKICEEL